MNIHQQLQRSLGSMLLALTTACAADGIPGVWDGTPPEVVVSGLGFTEGPAWEAATSSWIFSDIPANRLYRLSASGIFSIALEPSENANGSTIDASSGDRITCEHRTHRVVRSTTTDSRVLAEIFDGKPLNSPNDVAIAADQAVWFTDPTYGLTGRTQQQPMRGLYRIANDGAITRIDPTLPIDQPNGLCFSRTADGQTVLYLADSGSHRRVLRLAITDNSVSAATVFATIAPGAPDGVRCDHAGRLFVTADDGVQVFAPDGTKLGVIPTPAPAANCAFGDSDGSQLLITARTQVLMVKLATRGW